jgi:hypothetical protein
MITKYVKRWRRPVVESIQTLFQLHISYSLREVKKLALAAQYKLRGVRMRTAQIQFLSENITQF